MKLQEKMKKLGLDRRREYLFLSLYCLIIIGLGVAYYFYSKYTFALFMAPGAALMFVIFYISRYGRLLEERQQLAADQFVEAFTYFSIYIRNGYNVYRALEECSALSKEEVAPYFRQLLSDMDGDKSLAPFLAFSANFDSLEIKQVMLSVYQMIDEGGGESHIAQFSSLFGKFAEERHRLERSNYQNGLEKLSVLPLIGGGITMLSLAIAMLEIMGGLYNGI